MGIGNTLKEADETYLKCRGETQLRPFCDSSSAQLLSYILITEGLGWDLEADMILVR